MKELQHSSIEELFERGNYAEVARRADPDRWQTFAAMGLIGLFEVAHEGLGRFRDPDVPFYRAAIHWIAGEEGQAARLLEKARTPRSAKLLELIRKPQINILAQLSWSRGGSQDVLSGIAADTRFHVQNISFDERDLPNEPYADIRNYFTPDTPPDLFVSEMVEWHITPPNLQALPCPIIGQTSDYDLHIQALPPWLRLFDAFVAGDQEEWFDVGRISGRPIHTFPKFVGVPDVLPNIPAGDRPLDLFISGTVRHPYWPEKTQALFDLLAAGGLEYRIMQGFLPEELYRPLLGCSKTSISCLRHPAAMPSRALEALAMGCAIVVQEESALCLYLSEAEGLFSYRSVERDHVDVVQRVVRDWDSVQAAARRGMEKVRRDFSLSAVSSQYFRFLTFLASGIEPRRQAVDPRTLLQKRMVVKTGFLPRDRGVLARLWRATFERCDAGSPQRRSPQPLINAAREIMMYAEAEQGTTFRQESQPLFRALFAMLSKGSTQFPRSLVLRFNQLRALYHFGSGDGAEKALGIGQEILDADPAQWEVDPLDDVLAWDFNNNRFNYRSYFDAVTRHFVHGEDCRQRLVQLILAAVCGYVGRARSDTALLARACALDPDFEHYRLAYARATQDATVRDPETDAKVEQQLLRLSRGTVVFDKAYELLESAYAERGAPTAAFLELQKPTQLLTRNTVDVAQLWERVADRVQPGPIAIKRRRRGSQALARQRLSVIYFADGEDQKNLATLKRLVNQSIQHQIECFVCYSRENSRVADGIASMQLGSELIPVRLEPGASRARVLNECVARAQGALLSIVQPGLFFDAAAYENLGQRLLEDERTSLVYGDIRISHRQPLTASSKEEEAPAMEYHRRLRCTPRALFGELNLEVASLWRRELYRDCGPFEEARGDGAGCAFFIRAGLTGGCVPLRRPVGTVTVSDDSELRYLRADPTPAARAARQSLWPRGWGAQPEDGLPRLLPLQLAEAQVSDETRWAIGWGLVDGQVGIQQARYNCLAQELLLEGDPLLAEIILQVATSFARPTITSCLMLAALLRLRNNQPGSVALTKRACTAASALLNPTTERE